MQVPYLTKKLTCSVLQKIQRIAMQLIDHHEGILGIRSELGWEDERLKKRSDNRPCSDDGTEVCPVCRHYSRYTRYHTIDAVTVTIRTCQR